jgi:hypothetical protein
LLKYRSEPFFCFFMDSLHFNLVEWIFDFQLGSPMAASQS